MIYTCLHVCLEARRYDVGRSWGGGSACLVVSTVSVPDVPPSCPRLQDGGGAGPERAAHDRGAAGPRPPARRLPGPRLPGRAAAGHLQQPQGGHARSRRGHEDGPGGVPVPVPHDPLELLHRARQQHALRKRHDHQEPREGVRVRDICGRRGVQRDAGVRARRPQRVQLRRTRAPPQAAELAVGRLLRGHPSRRGVQPRVCRFRRKPRDGRGPDEHTQQRSRPKVDPVAHGARVQVPRHVGVVQHARLLAQAAALPARGRRAVCALRGRLARAPGARRPPPPRQEAARHQPRPQEAQQDRPRLPRRLARLLRAQRQHGHPGHARAHVQPDQRGHGRLQAAVLRPRLPDARARRRGEVPLPLRLVLQRRLRDVPLQAGGAPLQLSDSTLPPRAPHHTPLFISVSRLSGCHVS